MTLEAPGGSPELIKNRGVTLPADMRSGNIPGSLNVPYKDMLNADGTLKSPEDIKQALQKKNIAFERETPIAATCGSGMTACTVLAGLKALDKTNNVYLYDGSWAEYGKTPQTPDDESHVKSETRRLGGLEARHRFHKEATIAVIDPPIDKHLVIFAQFECVH